MTRAPNNGGIGGTEFTPEFKKYLELSGNKGELLRGPMQYPLGAQGGIQAGQFNDQYNEYLRKLGHIADPRIPEYNQRLLTMGARPPVFSQDLNPDRQSYAATGTRF